MYLYQIAFLYVEDLKFVLCEKVRVEALQG